MSEWELEGGVIGGYELSAVLRRGRYATTFLAREPRLGNRLVVMRVQSDEDCRDPARCLAFTRSASEIGGLAHPAIPPVHSMVELDGRLAIVRAHIPGRDLESRLAQTRRAELPLALALLVQLSDALEAAHAAGIVHGRVLPEHVIVDERGHAWLIGFGESRLTRRRHQVIAPECLLGETAGPATDVHGLAMLAFHLVTGTSPLARMTPARSLHAVTTGQLPTASEIDESIPEAASLLLKHALSPDATKRPQKPSELVHGLVATLGSSLISSVTPGLRREEEPSERAAARQRRLPVSVAGQATGPVLAEGCFAYVLAASVRDGAAPRVIKLAKRPEEIQPPASGPGAEPGWCAPRELDGLGSSARAYVHWTGAVGVVDPDPSWLLLGQARQLAGTRDRFLPAIYDYGVESDRAYLIMEHLEGPTLRELIDLGAVNVPVLQDIARSLHRLRVSTGFGVHGDLKPSNLIVTEAGARLIDPGYFGEAQLAAGGTMPCSVTTPLYYPWLQPDDGFAFGLMLWEAVLGQHPLSVSPTDGLPIGIGEHMAERIRAAEREGNHFSSGLRGLIAPRLMREGISEELEHALVGALGMTLTPAGELEERSSGIDLQEVASSLEPFVELQLPLA